MLEPEKTCVSLSFCHVKDTLQHFFGVWLDFHLPRRLLSSVKENAGPQWKGIYKTGKSLQVEMMA